MNSLPADNSNAKQSNMNNKTPFMKNFTQFFKKGSNAIGHLFKKKEQSLDNNKLPGKLTIVKDNNASQKFNPNSNATSTENKQIFKIEEDEEGKEKTYHLEDDDEDDDDDYDDDDEPEINPEDKIKIEEKNKSDSTEENNLSKNTTTTLKSQNDNKSNPDSSREESPLPSITTEQNNSDTNSLQIADSLDTIETNYDIHSVIHRIHYKGSAVNINEIPMIKFSKIKNKSKLLSFMGISKKSEVKKYMAFFDEKYLYFLKDIEIDKKDKNVRKIGNKINLSLFYNAVIGEFKHDGNDLINIKLEFLKDSFSEDTILKELYFEEKQAERFVNFLDLYLKRLNIQLFEENENGQSNTEEDDPIEINESHNKNLDDI